MVWLAPTWRARGDWRHPGVRQRLATRQPAEPNGHAVTHQPGVAELPLREPCFPACGDDLWVELLHDGDGTAVPKTGDVLLIHYTTLLAGSGSCVGTSRSDANGGYQPMRVVLGAKAVVDGMDVGLRSLSLGAIARIHCPSRFGYGPSGSGRAVPPDAALVFEVELVQVNERCPTGARPTPRELRALFAVPPSPRPLSRGAALARAAAALARSRRSVADETGRVAAGRETRRWRQGRQGQPTAPGAARQLYSEEADAAVAVEEESDADEEIGATGLAEDARAPWVARLRPPAGPVLCETRSFVELLRRVRKDVFRAAMEGDGPNGTMLLPGTRPIRRIAHGARWSSSSPSECVVLTGPRAGWPGFAWGWSFWERLCGDDTVVSKQRAPVFDSDERGETVAAECSLREYIRYARAARVEPLEEGAEEVAIEGAEPPPPLLYMNGVEVFERHPGLWDASYDKIPGTIENMTATEYRALAAQAIATAARHRCPPSLPVTADRHPCPPPARRTDRHLNAALLATARRRAEERLLKRSRLTSVPCASSSSARRVS